MTVEAQSLSAITALASNPPWQSEPTGRGTPLTLYIVRVPGSHDVFLSPLKPNDRVVHAHDVQSSLYYLHVNDATDLAPGCSGRSPQGADSSMTRIARKAIPTTAERRSLPTPPASPELAQAHADKFRLASRSDCVPQRKPVRPDVALPRTTPPTSRIDSRIMDDVDPAAHHTTLTLIRRDPSTGEQWNVARICDPPVEEVTSDTSQLSVNKTAMPITKMAGSPLFVDITNTEYAKFAHTDEPLLQDQDDGPRRHSRSFQRRVWLEGSKHADHTYSSGRPQSVVSLDSLGSSKSTSPILQLQAASKPSFDRNKGYAFQDPWKGRCDFFTSASGSALRCRRHVARMAHGGESVYDAISELRFNLPVLHQRSKSDNVSIDRTKESKRRSYFSPTLPRSEAPTAVSDSSSRLMEEEIVDYSLGRERAGGGFAGREPKLGKLIVHPHGQQMLDLVVAANLALWWRAYKRTSA